jgi:superoxide dismutase, Fe-Mn family
MIFQLPQLNFEWNALEPLLSMNTISYHYGKHYKSYITDLNKLVVDSRFENSDLETINKLADGPIYNSAAQVWNHNFYFEGLNPGKKNIRNGPLKDIIKESFGSVNHFKNAFILSGMSLFGSGWVWLVLNQKSLLEINQESNAGNPLRRGLVPLLTCDLWEHAYYLDYKDQRLDYLLSFWKLIDWDRIEKRYKNANYSGI